MGLSEFVFFWQINQNFIRNLSKVLNMKHKARSSGGSPSKVGKGKGGKGGQRDRGGASAEQDIDLADIPLGLPEFANGSTVNPKRYSSVLQRSEQDGIGFEDIDTLQLELEALLSATVVRKLTLKEEIKVLANLERYKGTNKRDKKGPGSPGKRGRESGRSSVKKFSVPAGKPSEGGSGGGGASAGAGKVIGVPKIGKSDSGSSVGGGGGGAGPGMQPFDPLQNEQIKADTGPKPNVPKNETPNRFWSFVEPYCAPITPDDIKLLDDLVRSHGDMSEYFRVPKLGQHYTIKWANEDLEYERNKSAAGGGAEGSENGGAGAGTGGETDKMFKKGEAAVEKTPFGELTQRLVAGLIEDNLMTSVEDSLDGAGKKGDGGSENESKSQLIKSLNVTNSEALEARVKKELQDQGILDPNEDDIKEEPAEMEQDEIYEELIRCQTELRAVSNHNLQQLKRLTKTAREELGRQELRNKLAAADGEVMEAYKRISAARSKKKPPSKKDKEQAWKALKEREIILKQLESA